MLKLLAHFILIIIALISTKLSHRCSSLIKLIIVYMSLVCPSFTKKCNVSTISLELESLSKKITKTANTQISTFPVTATTETSGQITHDVIQWQ